MSQMPRSQVDHQALYRVAFEQSLIGVAITTVQGEILEVNSAMCEVLGYSCEELTAMGFLGVTHPDDKATTDSILRALVAGEYSHHNFEKRYIAKSGRVIWAMVHIRLVPGCNSEPGRILHQIFDITQRHESERQLRESEGRYRAASEGSLNLFCLMQAVRDDNGKIIDFQIIDANERCLRLFNKPRAEVLGMLLSRDLPRSKADGFFDDYLAVTNTGIAIEEEFEISWPELPARWMHHQIVKAGDGVAVSARDITERKTAEASMRQSEEHFRTLAISNSRLLSEVNHRVRNNLASLIAIVSLMRRRQVTTAEFAADLTGKLRAMSQIHDMMAQAGWQAVTLGTLVRGLLASMSNTTKQTAAIEIDGPSVNLANRQCVPLTMTLQELFANSCKYGAHASPTSAGRVDVVWTVEPHETTSRITLRWTERGGPAMTRPINPSLGIGLITGFIEHDLAGKVTLNFPPEGADHIFEFDVKNIIPEDRTPPGPETSM